MDHVDVSALVEDLRAKGIDVVRVSYPDLIGVDRGRDVLIDELPTVMAHGIAFCRAAAIWACVRTGLASLIRRRRRSHSA